MTYEGMVAEDDMVAAYATFTGTNTGPMGDAPPTGKAVRMTFHAMFRIEAGKIAEIWAQSDRLGLLRQLGMFPAPATSGG